ncbi:MAG: FAD-dependent oxidoreductase [Oscillospiraceae bacterium]|nr:FAD-dependent oxidoreductase [Oscillospiraceae bacterium]
MNIEKINKELAKRFGAEKYSVKARREHLVLEGESGDWQEIVAAGYLAAKHTGKLPGCLVNDVKYLDYEQPAMRMPSIQDDSLEGATPDVLIIGGGVVGCAIARELSRWRLDVLLVDKECDVALHSSSRNDGMIHPGLDIHKSSQKYKYNKLGNAMYEQICAELQVPFTREGQYLCFPKKLPSFLLYLTKLYWRYLDVPSRVLRRKELFGILPGLQADLGSALFFPTAGSVCPYSLTIAYAENAIQNGARVSLSTAVLGMDVTEENGRQRIKAVRTNRGTIRPALVINAAGVFCEDIAAMAGDRFFSIHPRRGTNSILDKKISDSVSRYHASTLMTGHAKGAHTKGGGVIRTVHDNLLLGPNAVESPEKEDFTTSPESIKTVFDKQAKTSERLNQGQIITYFTGVRAATFEEDFVIRPGLYTENIIHAAGIQSPGLTAAPAIGAALADWVAQRLKPAPNEAFNPIRPAIVNAAALPDEERDALIKQNPDYGVILCRCEQVSRGEIVAALRRPLSCDSVDGVKRRVRAGMGRCQGGFCGPLVAQEIAKELRIPLERVRRSGEGSELLYGSIKDTEVTS